MSSPEKVVQDQIFTYLVSVGALVLRVNSGASVSETPGQARRFIRFVVWQVAGGALGTAGVSDILACYKGRFIAVEVKAPGKINNLSDAQSAFLEVVDAAGGLAIVADNVRMVEDIIAGLRD